MTKKPGKWIKEKIYEYKDYTIVQSLYETFQRETGSSASYRSYFDQVKKVWNKLSIKNPEFISAKPDEQDLLKNFNYSKEDLIGLIEERVQNTQEKISFSDLTSIASENNFPVQLFYLLIPDVKASIDAINKINLLNLQEKKSIDKLKREVKLLKAELKHYREHELDVEAILDVLDSAVSEYTPSSAPSYIPSHTTRDRVANLLISDTHFGETVDFEETHFLNEYNSTIAKERLDTYFHTILEWSDELQINKVYIKFLGDMVNGIIHEELVEHADLELVDSILVLCDYLVQWIIELKKYFKEVKILAVPGNHGRITQRKTFKSKNKLNFDYIMYEFMRRELKNAVTEFTIPKSFFAIHQILDSAIMSTHGDVFRGGTGLNPVSGTWGRDISKMRGLLERAGMNFQYAEFGHFHISEPVLQAFDGTQIIVNGSVKGTDEFSLGAVKTGSRPSQNYYVIEEGRGMIFKNVVYLD
jgi:hypothetical protein